jgi:hypothetical protein
LDVADEIAVDLATSECLAKSGYHWQAGSNFLSRLLAAKSENWLKWFIDNSVGLEYRVKTLGQRLKEDLNQQKFPESDAINRRRFEMALAQWNTLG